MPHLNGWILDVYPAARGMTVWVIDADSQTHCLHDTLTPSFFVYGAGQELHAVCRWIAAARLPVTQHRTSRYELFHRCELEVLEIRVPDPARFFMVAQTVKRAFPGLAYYNADVTPAQMYYFERGLFPLAHIDLETDHNRQILAVHNPDSPWALEYALPPLKMMTLKLEGEPETLGDAFNPNHETRPRPLEIRVEDTTRVLIADDPREMLLRFRDLLRHYDPDVLITSWGDSFILPRLLEMASRYGVPLPLNRDPERTIEFRRARSYFSYGRIVYKTASHLLFGRWHIDCDNAFLMDDYSLDGIFELARVSQLPVQRVARVSTGTCVSAMEIATAYHDQILIPVVKSEAEEWTSADRFVLADKGGLVFQPMVGLYQDVAELDFTSMFPTIMDKFNLSAETLNCPCCTNTRVPELGFRVCEKRRGLIPKTIAPLVDKRRKYKRLAKTTTDHTKKEMYKRRVSCLKWALVTVFGYTGYKNARFGKIEAHEAINAYGRDALLQAKELAEARGFKMLHAIVDAMYITKKNARDEEYPELLDAIETRTRLPIELEGIYFWIAFPPARMDARLGVANRYFGVFRDGEIKMRGIEARRHDTPPFIKQAQNEMLALLAQAKNKAEFRVWAAKVIELAADRLDTLRARQVPLGQLTITQRLSREPHTYKTNHVNALVARQLLDSGIELAAGESIRYVILDNAARVPSDRVRPVEQLASLPLYDVERYTELFLQSVATLLACVPCELPTAPRLMLPGDLKNSGKSFRKRARTAALDAPYQRSLPMPLGPADERTISGKAYPSPAKPPAGRISRFAARQGSPGTTT